MKDKARTLRSGTERDEESLKSDAGTFIRWVEEDMLEHTGEDLQSSTES